MCKIHKFPYLVTSRKTGIFLVFDSKSHKKKELDLRETSNLISLDCYSEHFEIKRFRGRPSSVNHTWISQKNETDLANLIQSKSKEDPFFMLIKGNFIYHQEFENLINYFKQNKLKINYGCVKQFN
ncbi:TPA: hypothetical protein I0H29_RS14730 [Enterococcus faecalis]|nr:hypothetical protein [Enterococcus faecalis]